jgi:hypothetical protein
MSSWAEKLESKLSTLTDTSSQESIAAVANWICFNRKHVEAFSTVLRDKLPKRQMLVVGLIHSVLLCDRETAKWDRGLDLRRIIGETVLLPNLEQLGQAAADKLLNCVKEWDEANAFGGPTIISQIRKQVAAGSKVSSVKIKDEPGAIVAIKEEPKEDDILVPKPTAIKSKSVSIKTEAPRKDDEFDLAPLLKKARTTSPASADKIDYDFDSKNIPYDPTEPSQLIESCSQVANIQIARDIRNDSAIKLNSLFTALPEDVRRVCAEAAETNTDEYALADDGMARDFGTRIKETLIDMDLNEQLQSLEQLRKMIKQQQGARENVLRLMIQSRCKFGSDQAAEAFYKADRAEEELVKRRQIILDAMELEGCGLEEDDEEEKNNKRKTKEPTLEPFTWHTPE